MPTEEANNDTKPEVEQTPEFSGMDGLVRITGISKSQLRALMEHPEAPVQKKVGKWLVLEVLEYLKVAAPKAGNKQPGGKAAEKLQAQIEKIKADTYLVRQKSAIASGKMVSRDELNQKLGEVASRQKSIFLARIVREGPIKMKEMDFDQRREYLTQTGDEFFAEMQTLLDFYSTETK